MLTDSAEDNENNLHSLNVDISLWEVAEAIGLAKHGKAMGHDRNPAEVLKNSTAVSVLHDLFNYCFKHGVTPHSSGKSIIHPIFKPGATDDPLQYLGINLISSISNIHGSISNKRLSKWSEVHEVINDCQNGFRKNRSTVDKLSCLPTILENRKIKCKSTFTAFIDLRKAYDYIDRNMLWYKLR